MRRQERSRSELIREAVLRCVDEGEWRRLLQYGDARARAKGISPDDVADLVEAYRGEGEGVSWEE